MLLIVSGSVLFAVACILEAFFRLRVWKAGDRSVLWMGGAYNYRRYHERADQEGWSHWPVYCMWVLYVMGLVLGIIGLLLRVGAFQGL